MRLMEVDALRWVLEPKKKKKVERGGWFRLEVRLEGGRIGLVSVFRLRWS